MLMCKCESRKKGDYNDGNERLMRKWNDELFGDQGGEARTLNTTVTSSWPRAWP